MPNYKREKQEFRFTGVNLNCAVDAIPQGQLGIGTNVRPNKQGTLSTRPAITRVLQPSNSPVHSLKRFTSLFNGSGPNLYADSTLADTGYSGDPLSFASYQSAQSDEPFAFVADRSRYSKIRANGTQRFSVGVVPPIGPPDAELIKPQYLSLSPMDVIGGWVSTGTSATVSVQDLISGDTLTATFIYDSGTTGWVSAYFNSGIGFNYGWIVKGIRITVGGEAVTVTEFQPQSSTIPTTISAIRYDAGTIGSCCVVLDANTILLNRNSLVTLDGELVRVLSVAVGEDNTVSFRCVTTRTHVAGEIVAFHYCVRMFLTLGQTSGSTVTVSALRWSTNPGVGYLSTAAALDLSQMNGRPVTQDDWMTIVINVHQIANLSLCRILLDINPSAPNDFTENYFYADITPNVLQAASVGLETNAAAALSTVQTSANQSQILSLESQIQARINAGDFYSAQILQGQLAALSAGSFAQQQVVPGEDQWTVVQIPLSSFTRVGGNRGAGWQLIKALRIEVTSASGFTELMAFGWAIGGTYGPNDPIAINPDNPIKYCYRYRSTITGARSTWSPLNRGGLFPERQGVIVSADYSTDPQVDTIDIARVGASIDGIPQYLSSIPNVIAGGTGTFSDNYNDNQLGDQVEPGDNQPWPIQQQPIIGTCWVIGTTVFNTSVTVPHNLCEGTIVLINGVATTVRGLPGIGTFQIEDNLDTGFGVSLEIGSPTTFGNPLPYLAGPFDEAFFAAGDPINPTRIYWGNRADPDGAKTSNYVDLPTTNPILGVGVYNGYVVAMTSEEFIVGTTSSGTSPYAFTTTSVGCGLLKPWAFTIGPAIFFWTRNGIAMTDLGPAKNISEADLYSFLPHEGVEGVFVNAYLPPRPDVQPRLAYCKNGWLYVDFQNVGNDYRTIAFDTNKPGWWFDVYTPTVVLHYQDEAPGTTTVLAGCTDGSIQQNTSNAKDSDAEISARVQLGANNFGDIRSLKQAIDLTLIYEGTVTVAVLANSWSIGIITFPDVIGTFGNPVILTIAGRYDAGAMVENIALELTWTGLVYISEWDLGYLQNPMLAASFVANPTPLAFDGYGHVREVILTSLLPNNIAGFTISLVIQCEWPGTMVIPVAIPTGAHRQYIPVPANKGMLYTWALQGGATPFGMFACEAHVKGWNEQAYRIASPFVE